MSVKEWVKIEILVGFYFLEIKASRAGYFEKFIGRLLLQLAQVSDISNVFYKLLSRVA